jgi:manganese-dependent inorganic pyrophosphatase
VVSDTLNLTSPTTTGRDREILGELEKTAGISAREFTEKLFASGSLLTHRSAAQAVTTDCKEYVEGDSRFSVAQIEEVGFDQFWRRKDELHEALRDARERQRHLFAALLVTDVTTQSSLLLVAGDPRLVRRIDYPEVQPGVFELRDVVSRKKQLLPYLTHLMQQG